MREEHVKTTLYCSKRQVEEGLNESLFTLKLGGYGFRPSTFPTLYMRDTRYFSVFLEYIQSYNPRIKFCSKLLTKIAISWVKKYSLNKQLPQHH